MSEIPCLRPGCCGSAWSWLGPYCGRDCTMLVERAPARLRRVPVDLAALGHPAPAAVIERLADLGDVTVQPGRLTVTVQVDTEPLRAALARAVAPMWQALVDGLGPALAVLGAALSRLVDEQRDTHRPRPLPIDGHAYRNRTRRRTRRTHR
ncbi:hypothetical protein [Umezawaea beigongshangensis]|uniref:hypothetical protein n=1 Tax=Umezawaea beigongshangensis TaxID=2780383 RepID=UPI0018F1C3DA|nr:hypothetical protein [Umezawaea beigongshangensis]